MFGKNGMTRRRRAVALAAAATLLQAHFAPAATFTWSGAGANVSWTNPANWNGTAPVGAGSDVLTFDGSTNTTNTNDFPSATTFAGINFASTAGAFALNGNAITLGGDILDSSANPEVINLGLTLSGSRNMSVAGGALLLNGVLTRNAGSTVQFSIPSGAINTTRANAIFTGGQQTILGGWATMGDTWAVSGSGASAGAISALPTGAYSTTYAAGTDVDSPTTGTVSSMTINSLRINAAAATSVTFSGPITIATGGILVTSNVGATGTLSGSSVTSGNGQDLIITVNNQSANRNFIISSQITGNIGLTINANHGQVQLNTLANYTGNTVVNSGRFGVNVAGSTSDAPAGSLIIINGNNLGGGQCYENASVTTLANNMQLSGLGWAETGGSYGAFRAKGGTVTGNIQLIGDARIGGNNNYTISGAISGAHELEIGAGTNSSSTGNTITLTNAGNSWSGGTRISRGTLKLGVDNAIPANSLLTFGTTVTTGTLSIMGTAAPILDMGGFNETLGGVTIQSSDSVATGSANITNTGAAKTLTINNSADFSFGGTITGPIALTKTGAGRQTLGGSNSYSGDTNINTGVLSVVGATASTSQLKVNTSATSAGTLAGTGSVGNVTLAADNGSNRAHVTPGATSAAGSIGTLTMNSVNVSGGNFTFDLGAGSNTSDSIVVTGAANFSGPSTITPIGVAGAGSYTLLTASSLTLTTLPTLELAAGSPSGYSLDFSTPNVIRLIEGSPPPPPTVKLYWTGATDNNWDTSTQNWTDTNVFTTFGSNDDVNFVDGALNRTILLSSAISLGNATFSGNTDTYSIGGPGSISSTQALTKSGSGMVTLSVASISFAGISVSNGTLALATNTSAGSISVTGGTARLSAVGSFSAITVSGGNFDVTDSPVIVDYTNGSPIQSIRTMIAGGYASGSWNGSGINSSVAAADPAHRAALGYAEASTLGLTSFAGHSLDNSAVVIEYTIQGDTNLDGVVNALDFNALATHFGATSQAVWTDGDVNYDGQVNTADFTILSQNFAAPPPPGPSLVVVPEPCSIALVLATGSLRRPRHRKKAVTSRL
jgi:autotransporter-associated beta strand protein